MKCGLVDLICKHCGASFKKRADRVGDNNFCDLKCRKAWTASKNKEELGRNCLVCNTEFVARRAQIVDGGGKYCSNKCATTANRGIKRTDETKARMSKALRESPNVKGLKGQDSPCWKGGRYLANGYWWLTIDGGKVAEHRYVMEQHLGRALGSNEIVHHKNHDKQDNRIENLQIMDRAEHMDEHRGDFNHVGLKGEDNGSSKLLASDVIDIRESCEDDSKLAEIYGVTKQNISHIRAGRTWTHV